MVARRTFLWGAISLPLVTACQEGARPRPVSSVSGASPVPSSAATGPLSVIYVAAWNCTVCPNFDLAQIQPYERSPQMQRAPLRRVTVPNYRAIWTSGGYWPADLEWVRVQAPQISFGGGRGGAPHTILVRGDTIIERQFGWRGWTNIVQPRITRELALT